MKQQYSENYHYIESGLNNVYIRGLKLLDDAGETYIEIPYIKSLHLLIASQILQQKTFISGREFYFLRALLGYSRETLAKKLDIATKDVILWEQEEYNRSNKTELLFRTLVFDKLNIGERVEKIYWSKDSIFTHSTATDSILIEKIPRSKSNFPYRIIEKEAA